MIATRDWYSSKYRCTEYPPSVLIVGSNTSRVKQLKKGLEADGCQVFTETKPEAMITSHKYFDLAILDINDAEEGLKITKNLEPLLRVAGAAAPIVLLTRCDLKHLLHNRPGSSLPVYHICDEASIETTLLQIVKQAHYMMSRYQ